MANLPAQYPHLSLHLADRTLTPLVTSARTEPQLQALSATSHTAFLAHEAASHLGHGKPQRIMVEHGPDGPVLLHSFLSPAGDDTSSSSSSTTSAPSPESATANAVSTARQRQRSLENRMSSLSTATTAALQQQYSGLTAPEDPDVAGGGAWGEEDDPSAPPMLLTTVIAPGADSVLDARRASARLERVGREVQHRWFESLQQASSQQDESDPTARS
ncbi:hypothetical protein BX600DRAFT_434115 [Xylariales sp. PMI_506]|nr:hypothetical protein BX600DRAFT_434115 [Xylariales sp. PMI_506]